MPTTSENSILKRITGPFREFGPGAGSLYVIDRILGRVSPHLKLYVYELMVQPITDKPLVPGRLASSVEIREIRRGDPEVERMPARPDIKESRFSQGAICLGAYQKGRLIGFMWFCHDRYDEDEVRCTYVLSPENRAVFDFDFYLFPEHRMGLGFVGLWNGANAYLRSQGIDFTFSRLTRFNLTSRRAHQHLGWKLAGRALFFQAGRFELMFSSVLPYVSITAGAGRRVELRLNADALRQP